MTDRIWQTHVGTGPLVATAIHDGHDLRDELSSLISLDSPARRREEDPFTAGWTAVAPTRVVGLRSRFQVDLNRPRDKAVYRAPEDAWGLQVWKQPLPDEIVERSLAEYDAFYAHLEDLYGQLARRHGVFVVYDLHTYNHRRQGPAGPPADAAGNPQVNLGTGTLSDRGRFAGVIAAFLRSLRQFDFPSGPLDVRENVKFFGGNHPRWAHATFPGSACVLAIEFKKFFMDEWTGTAETLLVEAIRAALAATVPEVLAALPRS
jgi:hypothetical protein